MNGIFVTSIEALNGGILRIVDAHTNSPVATFENGMGGIAANLKNGRNYRFTITLDGYDMNYFANVSHNAVGMGYGFEFVKVA